ncbi:MAG: tetratricopeptide repeat protein [Pseudonocardiaceae bacterium]
MPHHHDDHPRGGIFPHRITRFRQNRAAAAPEAGFAAGRRLADQLDTPQAQRDLSISLNNVGDVARDLGDLDTAATHYQQALDINRRLAQQLDTDQAHRDLGWALTQLGDVARDLGDPTIARIHHQQALDINRRLAEQLGTARALRDVHSGLSGLTQIEEELGDTEAAAALRAELTTVSDQLAALDDGTPDPS